MGHGLASTALFIVIAVVGYTSLLLRLEVCKAYAQKYSLTTFLSPVVEFLNANLIILGTLYKG